MAKKRGRPTAENPLTEQIRVRFTKGDAERLDRYRERHHETRASAIRRATLETLDRDEATEE